MLRVVPNKAITFEDLYDFHISIGGTKKPREGETPIKLFCQGSAMMNKAATCREVSHTLLSFLKKNKNLPA